MNKFFNLNNPVWKFIGNIADFFFLTLFWILTSLPLVTIGASTTALYYVTLKMTRDLEGKLWQQYWKSFKENLKQGIAIWLGFAAVGIILFADLYYGINGGTDFASAILITAGILTVLYLCVLSFVFVLLARVSNTAWNIVKMACAMTMRNFLPILAGAAVWTGLILVGVFVFWPLLLITPGMGAYLNSFLYNRILDKYGLSLK